MDHFTFWATIQNVLDTSVLGLNLIKRLINWVPIMKESGLFQDILFVVERVARNAKSLINMDSNVTESYNSVVAKFVGGKRINFTTRRTYSTGCEAAAISYNVPAGEFASVLHKKILKSSPGLYTNKIIAARAKGAKWIKSRKITFPRIKDKIKRITSADSYYGLPWLDLDGEEYERRKKEFLESIQKSKEEVEELQITTLGQAECMLWREERRKRLTASVFGQICKQRLSTHCSDLLKNILYSSFGGNFATNWGKEHEKIAMGLYEELNNVQVTECGFFVDIEKPYLGTTPGGLIGEQGIVEVKCPQIAATKTPKEAIKKKYSNLQISEIRSYT